LKYKGRGGKPTRPKKPLSWLNYAQLKPSFDNGSLRGRLPVAEKMALATAGRIGGMEGSPNPVGGLFDFSQCTSISLGRRLGTVQDLHGGQWRLDFPAAKHVALRIYEMLL
jgi:hypothetical protein